MAFKHLKLARRLLQSNLKTLEHPFKLNFIVTKECHSKCENCHIWKLQAKGELTLDEIQRIACNSPFLSWITFAGGEPTDRKDFPEIVKAFLDHCPELLLLHFPTNGLRPKRILEHVHQILQYNPPELRVTVSIDGPPETNDRIRGIRGDFKLAVETLEALWNEDRVQSYVGMTLYESNHQQIDQTLHAIREHIPEFGYDQFHINLPHVSRHYYGNEVMGALTQPAMIDSVRVYLKHRGSALSPANWIESRYHKLGEQYLRTGKTPLDCSALSASCYLGENGTVFPCSIWDRPLGNVRDTGYDMRPLLNNQTAAHCRQEIREKKCANCWTPCEAYQTILSNIGGKAA